MAASTRADDLEPLDQFVAREGAEGEPSERSRYQLIDARLRARREIDGLLKISTRQEAATGSALSPWLASLLDAWIAAQALPARQREVIRLSFLVEHQCEGSGTFAGYGLSTAPCGHCPEPKRYKNEPTLRLFRVGRDGRLAPHPRQWSIGDVAAALGVCKRTVSADKKAAMATIMQRIWPDAAEEDPDGDTHQHHAD
jgi:hypothetical protein